MLPHLLFLRHELFTIVEAILLLSLNIIAVIFASYEDAAIFKAQLLYFHR